MQLARFLYERAILFFFLTVFKVQSWLTVLGT